MDLNYSFATLQLLIFIFAVIVSIAILRSNPNKKNRKK